MAITTTTDVQATNSATPTLDFGFTASAGDLIICLAGKDGNGTVTWPGSWVEIKDAAHTGGVAFIAYLIAAGGETSVVPTATVSERWEVIFVRIPTGEWHGTTPPEISTGATGSSTTPDPDALSPSWGAVANTIAIATCFRDDSTLNTVTGWPTDYVDNQTDINSTTSAQNVACAIDFVNAASIDPGAFTLDATETWAAYTIAVRPAAGGATFALAGTPSGTGVASGTITHSYTVAGTASGTAALTGALAHAYAIAGLAAGTGLMVGDATLGGATFALAGTPSGTASLTGAITHRYNVAATASGVATLAAALSNAYAIAGAASGSATVTGSIVPAYGLAGQPSGTASLTGAITHAYGLGGLAAAVAAAVGDLQSGVIVLGDAVIDFVQRADGTIDFTIRAHASLDIQQPHEATLTAMALEYDLSDTTRPTVTFTVSDAVTDPTTVTLTVIPPDKTPLTYTYAGATITKSSTGVYYKDISLTQRGIWYFRFVGTGACEAAVEGTVTVRA